ncbi:MAG: hypothetical protein EXR27_16125 [Betaproteobacteria bacterium]|nr:hypothetical protein [Betaproteobacteria bacterium]
MKDSQPHTARLETPEVIAALIERIEKSFAVLREQLHAYRPDALLVIGDDQNDLFSFANMPTLAVYTGKEVWGASKPGYTGIPPEQSRIHLKVHTELAQDLIKGLVKRDFDPANLGEMMPLGREPARGASHMMMYPAPKLMPDLDIPVIPVFLNEYFPPLPSGRRCWNLGLAIADIFKNHSARIAMYASGGLSHDPNGPRAGWIDEPMDHWILERIASNRGEELTNLFSFDSATVRGGSGEIRAWISVAAACRRAGVVVDYFPVHHAKTGVGFAYWPAIE